MSAIGDSSGLGDGDIGPGLHFKAPWPIDSVYVPEYYTTVVKDGKGRIEMVDRTATGMRTIDLGTSLPGTNGAGTCN